MTYNIDKYYFNKYRTNSMKNIFTFFCSAAIINLATLVRPAGAAPKVATGIIHNIRR